MVFVDLPEVGATVAAGADCAVAESVEAALRYLRAPISGEIVAVNEELNGLSGTGQQRPVIPTAGSSRSNASDEARVTALLDAAAG